jgi:hypothetical protein
MGIEVQLRSEDGEIIDSVGEPEMVLSRAARKRFNTGVLGRKFIAGSCAATPQRLPMVLQL